ncbi:hypothetical protein [Thermococcus sp. 21S7]|uniref:hypothetical protein n=1 Tax=Thermococcus sp. 21S7 TaxID=1638221 RepID=UPI00169EC1A9|nr:hypothetical protein [Thermococcus sp. 21S7]NJE60678.1 hypothetical protein [Thermococcus sp. 21S7]
MIWLLMWLILGGGEVIINREGVRKDLLAWHLKDVTQLAAEHENAFRVLIDLLSDDNPHVRANALQVIEDLIKEGKFGREYLNISLGRIIELTKDDDERVALKALEVLNLLLEAGELSEDEYETVTSALMDVLKSGLPILSEYAAEGLGKIGAKVARIAYKLINWLFSLVGSSGKRDVQSAAVTALTEMASKTEDPKVLNEVFDKMADLLMHPDPYILERAVMSIDRLLSRADEITTRNKLKAINNIKRLRGDVQLGMKASLLLEKLEKASKLEEVSSSPEVLKKTLEVTRYSLEDIDRLLDAGKPEIVAEMAKLDPLVFERVLEMLEDQDYTRRMDALWVVSHTTEHLTPSDAYRILPILGEYLKSKNPWARETAMKIMADIYTLYPGTSKFFASLVDVLLKSGDSQDTETALELLTRLADRVGGEEFEGSSMRLVFKLLKRDSSRGAVLRFLAREAQRLVDMNTETLLNLLDVLKGLYGTDGGKHDEIIASLIDVIEDILRLRQRGVVIHT